MSEDQARQLITLAVGKASMCWESPEKAGVFDSNNALTIADDLLIDLGFAAPEPLEA